MLTAGWVLIWVAAFVIGARGAALARYLLRQRRTTSVIPFPPLWPVWTAVALFAAAALFAHLAGNDTMAVNAGFFAALFAAIGAAEIALEWLARHHRARKNGTRP